MSIWGRIFAATYDHMMSAAEEGGLRDHRRALVAEATGDVLEIGGGTGANLPFYGENVRTLTITEPETPMARRLERRLEQFTTPVGARLVQAPGEQLPFGDASFDTIVSTLVLCTVSDQPQALRELRRVLRPDGRLLFMEHVRARDGGRLARWQDRMVPVNVRVAHGCHCNRRTLDGLRDAGFEITELTHDQITHVPPLVRPLVFGVARHGAQRSGSTPAELALSDI